MACMEHDCRDCGEMWFDNKPDGECPKCESTNVAHFHDEQDDNNIEIEMDDADDAAEEAEDEYDWSEVDDDDEEELDDGDDDPGESVYYD